VVRKDKQAIAVSQAEPEDAGSLRKPVEAIAVKPHAGKITLLTRKITNVLMKEAQEQGLQVTTYRMSLTQLCSKAKYDSTNTQLLKEQLRRMASTTVEWNVGAKGARRWGITSMIEVEILEEDGRCWIEWGYPAKLKAKMLNPDIYARVALGMQDNFSSNAAMALYEICIRYVDSPGRLTMRMPWEEWRPRLTGVPDGSLDEASYTQYKYFKRDVLKPAVAEVGKLPRINFDVELLEHKSGKMIKDIQFRIIDRKQPGLDLDEPNMFDLTLISRMTALGFTDRQAEKIYSDHEEPKLRAALAYTEKRIKQSPPLDSPQGYFRKALSAGYGNVAPGQLAGEQQKALEKGKPSAEPSAKAEDVTKHLAEAWRNEQRQRVRAEFDTRSAEDQAKILAVFATNALPGHLAKKWRAEGLRNQLCAAAFIRHLLSDVPEPNETELLLYGLNKGLISTKA
jgi:hypothetical protein